VRLIEKVWFEQHQAKYWLVPLLLPVTLLFYGLSLLRRLAFRFGIFKALSVEKPVVVVGNIGVGGNGKTPVVVCLVELAKRLGLKPGVISRGYGGTVTQTPYLLNETSTTDLAGDEPVLIYQRCSVPVVVGPDRVANARKIIAQGCDVVISDDGLQHYRLQRDLELIVIDGKRLFGNGLLLPAGPLREGKWRLALADVLIYNGRKPTTKLKPDSSLEQQPTDNSLLMTLAAKNVVNIKTGETMGLELFLAQWPTVNAIAGIGDPQRFFDTLTQQGFALSNQQGFIDHKSFSVDDFIAFTVDLPLLMTEKDAVKCQPFAQGHWWYLPVTAQFSAAEQQILTAQLKRITLSKTKTKTKTKTI